MQLDCSKKAEYLNNTSFIFANAGSDASQMGRQPVYKSRTGRDALELKQPD